MLAFILSHVCVPLMNLKPDNLFCSSSTPEGNILLSSYYMLHFRQPLVNFLYLQLGMVLMSTAKLNQSSKILGQKNQSNEMKGTKRTQRVEEKSRV